MLFKKGYYFFNNILNFFYNKISTIWVWTRIIPTTTRRGVPSIAEKRGPAGPPPLPRNHQNMKCSQTLHNLMIRGEGGGGLKLRLYFLKESTPPGLIQPRRGRIFARLRAPSYHKFKSYCLTKFRFRGISNSYKKTTLCLGGGGRQISNNEVFATLHFWYLGPAGPLPSPP